MKKLIPFLSLFYFWGSHSQIIEIARNCQTGAYNLTQAAAIAEMSNYEYIFFETLANAENNVSPLTGDLSNYLPAEGQEFVYAREFSPYLEQPMVKTIPFRENFTALILFTSDIPASGASVVTFSGLAPFTYEWFIDNTLVPGETTSTFDLSAYNYPEIVTCVVTDANGCSSITGGYNGESSTYAINDFLQINIQPDTELITDRSVLENDVYQNYPVLAVNDINLQAVPTGEGWENFSLDSDGKISVTATTPFGNYSLQYQMVSTPDMTVLGTATINLRIAKAALKLTAFIDTNSDGQKQLEEPYLLGGNFINLPQTPQFYAPVIQNESTIYSIITTADPVSIKVEGYNNFPTNFPNLQCYTYYENVPLTLDGPLQELLFPFVPTATGDLSINTGTILPSPGFTRPFLITVTNPTTQSAGPLTVQFTKPQQSQITTYPLNSTQTEEGFSLLVESLNALSTIQIGGNIQFDVIPNVSLNDPVSMSATLVYAEDPYTDNNTSTFNAVFMGSYDPNDIIESRGPEIRISDFSENDYLTYTIRFENTGNAAAENIRIINELPSGLDTSTVQVLGASHPFQKSLFNGVLTVRMDNIELPPSNGSATIGNGFITYRVKPTAGFTVGTQIENSAEIYFDFNPPIVTPTWTTTFVEQLSVEESQPLVQFYTNPVTDVFELTLVENQANAFATVYDLKGSILAKVETVNGKLQIETQNWMSGIYILKLQSGDTVENIKVIKR